MSDRIYISVKSKNYWFKTVGWMILGAIMLIFPPRNGDDMAFNLLTFDQIIGLSFILLGIGNYPGKLTVKNDEIWLWGSRKKGFLLDRTVKIVIHKDQIQINSDDESVSYEAFKIKPKISIKINRILENYIAQSSRRLRP